MPRRARWAPGGYIYHVLNRGVGRRTLFHKPADYEAFFAIMAEAHHRHPARLLTFCLMPNHWHMVIWPQADEQLSQFVGWLSLTHSHRHHAHYRTVGEGHLYQGRFKSFPVEEGPGLLAVCRYVERNALRANLVPRAEHWPWSALHVRLHGPPWVRRLLHPWPWPRPADWIERVNEPQTPDELDGLRQSAQRGRPFGSPDWLVQTSHTLALTHTLRPRGRPKLVNQQKG